MSVSRYEATGSSAYSETCESYSELLRRGALSSHLPDLHFRAYRERLIRKAIWANVRILWQAAVYGACVNAKYLEVEKDMCKPQFMAFKECVVKAVSLALFLLSSIPDL